MRKAKHPICVNCGTTESTKWHNHSYEVPDAYGIACAEPSVPTTNTIFYHACDKCETAPLMTFCGLTVDDMSIEQIDYLIDKNILFESDLVAFYGSTEWRDIEGLWRDMDEGDFSYP